MLLWASAFVSIRWVAPYFHPGVLALGRLFVGSVVLGGILVVRREGLPSRAAWPGIIASGVLWFGVYMVALNWGEHEVDAGTAAMLIKIGPLLIAVLGGVVLREGFPPRLVAGMAVSFVGVVVVGLSMSDGGRASIVGVLLCLLAAVVYSLGVVSQKPALRHGSALQVTTFGCVIGMVTCLPFAGQLMSQVAVAPRSAILNMAYLGVFPTALAFTTWAYALARTTAGKMGATTYVVPALVVLMSWSLLGEVPALPAFVGGLLCLAGVFVSRGRRPVPRPAEPVDRPKAVGGRAL
ncbi:MAG TPA: DMT family transporter [Thermopolyspora sp.]